MNEEAKRKILIIDDDDFTREMYVNVFRNADYDVLEANDGVAGLDLATEKTPDVIFTGIVMPRMDGFSLIEALSKNTSTSSIPVVMSSHLGREDDRKRAEQLGVKGFIVRDTTTPREVVETVTKLFTDAGEFVLEFDPYALDAQRMARQLRINSHFQCMECGEKLILKLHVARENGDRYFRARFVCPNCGWQV